eukprot:402296-Heterocapsa_arctica.AAC.1
MSHKRKSDEVDEDKEDEEEEPSDTEDDEPMEGAQSNDMNKFQRVDIIKWMDNNPERKADAMMDFDKELIKNKGVRMSSAQDTMSGRIYDAVIGNHAAYTRGWLPLERHGNQALG